MLNRGLKNSISRQTHHVYCSRPKNISEVTGQDDIVRILEQSLNSQNVQFPRLSCSSHICYFMAHLVQVKHLRFLHWLDNSLGNTLDFMSSRPELMKQRLLELNASDERGISVIREKVKNFAMVSVRDTVPNYPCPPFKIIVLDEADSLTNDAQNALRRIMEIYSNSTRFCIICNYVSRIIDPITSRCAKFRFRQIDVGLGINRLTEIAEKEGVKLQDRDVLAEILRQSSGDLRRSITLLQAMHQLNCAIDSGFVQEMAGVVPQSIIEGVFEICQKGTVQDILKWTRANIILNAYSAKQVLKQLSDGLFMHNLSSEQAARISLKIAEVEYALFEGADEFLQLLDVFVAINQE